MWQRDGEKQAAGNAVTAPSEDVEQSSADKHVQSGDASLGSSEPIQSSTFAGSSPAPEGADRRIGGNKKAKPLPALPDGKRGAVVAKRLSQTPKASQRTYLRAVQGKAAPRTAIKAFCLECVGWDRAAVRDCTALACPLWAYRPFAEDSK